ncbi:MAG: hypothetical protein R3B69_00990 [Candidatus Paceibacterota bacterium]
MADIEATVALMRERRDSLSDDDVRDILKAGAEKARIHAEQKMTAVRRKSRRYFVVDVL